VAAERMYSRSLQDVARSIVRVEGDIPTRS